MKMAGYVFLGGALGSMLRYMLAELIAINVEFPTSELIALTVTNNVTALMVVKPPAKP